MSPLTLVLTPAGHLLLRPAEPADALPEPAARRIAAAFARGHGPGLLHLGTSETRTALPPSAAFWRDLGHAFVAALCSVPGLAAERERAEPAPRPGELERLASEAPPMPGGEYLTAAVLLSLWAELLQAWRAEMAGTKETVQAWLAARDPAWSLVGRVHLHLAENRRDEDRPFAFLATYTTGLSRSGKPQHRACATPSGRPRPPPTGSGCWRCSSRCSAPPSGARW